ncbi:MAG: peptidyl-prolyl cis-trans isomerase [Bacteroidetes bacterium SB0662_bin_6]|nr:peptidyl-prolyl cis-trans isomerase [Bacteroidetes bacterium SB0668_bin_1]MYE05251.1 peptidyl-prolyl cis-trans isomerase [Bacteroidetes bacterium SB0662_bin_6]
MFSRSKPISRAVSAALFIGLSFAAGCGLLSRTAPVPGADNPEVVASFDGELFTLEDFEANYAPHSGSDADPAADSLASYRDFLERYVDFRLKVAAAREAGMDTRADILEEIQSYRLRLARPFLMEKEIIDPIIRTLHERRQEMIDVSHILLSIQENAPAEDTLAAYLRMQALRDSVLQGVDFGELAFRHSQDPSAQGPPDARGARGRLGFFTGGDLVEPFESFTYDTPVGGLSPVFRTRFGYHMLMVHERRPAEPGIRIAHIMIRHAGPPGDSTNALVRAEALKIQLDEGADFAELAVEHSEDMMSAGRGGDIGSINYSTPVPETFKEAAYSLAEPGDITGPVETSFGIHIIQLTERGELPSFEEAYEDLKTLAGQLPRTGLAEEALAQDIIQTRQGHIDTTLVLNAFAGLPPDSILILPNGGLDESALADTFFVLGDSTWTLGHLAETAGSLGNRSGSDTESTVRELVSSFVTEATLDAEAARLEERDAEFGRIMQEFRDGLVLFALMEDSVWTAADQDSAALRAHYAIQPEAYQWPDRIRAISLQSASDSLLQDAAARFDAGASIADIHALYAADTLYTLHADTTLIADSSGSVYDRILDLSEGERTEILALRSRRIILVHDGIESARPKTFEEARTEIVSEHQNVLEERLLARLRERYNAHTFPDRLVRAFREESPPMEHSDTPTAP